MTTPPEQTKFLIPMEIFKPEQPNAASEKPAVTGTHCQNGGDVCLAGNRDGVCCPEDSCDIDDGMRKAPSDKLREAAPDPQESTTFAERLRAKGYPEISPTAHIDGRLHKADPQEATPINFVAERDAVGVWGGPVKQRVNAVESHEYKKLQREAAALRTQLREWIAANGPGGWIDALRRRVAELENDCERERMRLAACGVAALGYFTGCLDEYKSASLDDVLRLQERLAAEVEARRALERERDTFYMDYRIKCDKGQKAAEQRADQAEARLADTQQRNGANIVKLEQAEAALEQAEAKASEDAKDAVLFRHVEQISYQGVTPHSKLMWCIKGLFVQDEKETFRDAIFNYMETPNSAAITERGEG